MSDIFQITGVGLLQAQDRLEAISANAAGASLPGYRRHVAVARPFAEVLAASEAQAASRTGPPRSGLNGVDLRAGAISETGRALDVSIDADDLFFALTDGTQTWLTRSGAFRVDGDGVLVGEGGLRVTGTQGDIRLPGSDVTVEGDGRLTHRGVTVGSLQLYRTDDPGSLQALHGSLLVATAGMYPAEADVVRVRGGTLEASNTDSTREMLDLVVLSRQYESLSRVMQGYDELLGRFIQKLGEG